jgi:hypothetical protein
MPAAKRSERSLSGRIIRTRWFGRRIVGDTTCAPTTDRFTSVAGFPSIITSMPLTTLKRGARRVPR